MNNYFIVISIFFLFITSVFSCKKDDNTSIKDSNSPVGASANAFLADSEFKKMNLEIIYMSTVPPNEDAVEHLKSFLLNHLKKPSGINIKLHQIETHDQPSYSIEDLKEIESEYRQEYNKEDIIAASLIIVDGEYASNNQVLGVAYKNTSMALFGKTIAEYSGGLSQPTKEKLEATIMNHEMGHLLGLVNVGTSMVENHQDSENGSHCDNDECLMYFAVETTEIASFLVGNNIPTLDQNCKNDLIANGGK